MSKNLGSKVNKEEKDLYEDDPDMYKNLGITRVHRTQMSTWDAERIVAYQLHRDTEWITKNTGSYKEKVINFFNRRGDDVNLKNISRVRKLGDVANFKEVSEAAAEISWKATSKPHGEVAERHYQEWLASRPKGPSADQIKAWKQKDMDYALWDKILHGRDEAPKYVKNNDKSESKLEARMLAFEEEERIKSGENSKVWNLKHGYFDKNRAIITELDLEKFNIFWSKGVYIDHDLV